MQFVFAIHLAETHLEHYNIFFIILLIIPLVYFVLFVSIWRFWI